MKKSGIIARGWVSEFIPNSAYSIKETHNIDTNTVHMSFKYNVSDGELPKDSCTLMSETDKGWKYVCPPYKGSTNIITLRQDGMGYYSSYSDDLGY
jgi:hypothetical protein